MSSINTESFSCPERIVPGEDSWRNATDHCCNYCGSINPEDFMTAVREGVKLTQTDKNYKVYVGQDNKKFYFKHLSMQQKIEFIELYNTNFIVVAGGFYVLPYFMTYKD
jgi:hypothetical protein